MRLTALLGSGVSLCAGMPGVATITEQVLSGRNVHYPGGADFRILDSPPRDLEFMPDPFKSILKFVHDLETLSNGYFDSQHKRWQEAFRKANYEDIAYLAHQIDDGLGSQYENPALLPLAEGYREEHGLSFKELQELASSAAGYIEDTVKQMVGGSPSHTDYLGPLHRRIH